MHVLTTLLTLIIGVLYAMSHHASTPTGNQIQQLTTPGGLTVWLTESHQIPMVSFEVAFRAGSGFDPAGKEGLANLTAALMDEGAAELDSTAFKEALDDLGARFGGSAATTLADVSLDTLSQHTAASFNLMAKALTAPRFDTEATERIKAAILSGIQRREESPSGIAQRLFRESMFPGHPYGHLTEGTAASVQALTADDVRAFYQKHYTKANMSISVVGDITAEELTKLLDSSPLANLPAGSQTPWPQLPASIPHTTQTYAKDTPQSSIILGRLGVGRKDTAYYPTIVTNEVLGGGVLTSRLFDTVREKNGLAYDVRSTNTPLPGGGLFTASVQTNNDTAEKALTLIRQELAHMAADGLTDEELADIKSYLVGSFPLRLDSNAKILAHLTLMQQEDLGADYLTKWPQHINAVTKEEAHAAAKSLLDITSRTLVIVGNGPALNLK